MHYQRGVLVFVYKNRLLWWKCLYCVSTHKMLRTIWIIYSLVFADDLIQQFCSFFFFFTNLVTAKWVMHQLLYFCEKKKKIPGIIQSNMTKARSLKFRCFNHSINISTIIQTLPWIWFNFFGNENNSKMQQLILLISYL